MIYKVNLALFKDDATGDYGFAHKNAIGVNEPFNAFWTHQGIFHDVFEHYFEDNHPYFKGNYAFNIGGEVAAMGHLAWYYHSFYLPERWFSNAYSSKDQIIIGGTKGDMEEAIAYGYHKFGQELLCKVPYQKESDGDIENIIHEHWLGIKDEHPRTKDSDELEAARIYKKSVKEWKLKRLYRWGYQQAAKKFPRTDYNREKLEEFLDLWKKITTNNNAETLYNYGIKECEFTIKTGKKMSWKAEMITSEGQRVVVNGSHIEELLLDLNFDE